MLNTKYEWQAKGRRYADIRDSCRVSGVRGLILRGGGQASPSLGAPGRTSSTASPIAAVILWLTSLVLGGRAASGERRGRVGGAGQDPGASAGGPGRARERPATGLGRGGHVSAVIEEQGKLAALLGQAFLRHSLISEPYKPHLPQ